MSMTTFDSLRYARKLEEAGFTRQQAEAQAEIMREYAESQHAAIREYDENLRRDLATKGDLREAELRLQTAIEKIKYDLLKWQIAGCLALAAIMAKGFGWLGF